MRVKSVDVNVHWAVFLVCAIMLLNAGRKPVLTLAGLLCYLNVLLIHECGHLIAAQQRGSHVHEIRPVSDSWQVPVPDALVSV